MFKVYRVKFKIFEYYVIFIYFQAAVSALLAVSVVYIEKKNYVIFWKFKNLTHSFSYDIPATLCFEINKGVLVKNVESRPKKLCLVFYLIPISIPMLDQ